MKLTTAAVIAFSAASSLALTIPYQENAVYARDMYERDSGEGVLTSLEKRREVKHASSKSKPGQDRQVHTGGFATYYNQDGVAGACGKVHSDNALIVAIDSARYSTNICGKKVKITNTANDKSVVAAIADECPGCRNKNSIDLSLGAFRKIADYDQGRVDINWVFV